MLNSFALETWFACRDIDYLLFRFSCDSLLICTNVHVININETKPPAGPHVDHSTNHHVTNFSFNSREVNIRLSVYLMGIQCGDIWKYTKEEEEEISAGLIGIFYRETKCARPYVQIRFHLVACKLDVQLSSRFRRWLPVLLIPLRSCSYKEPSCLYKALWNSIICSNRK